MFPTIDDRIGGAIRTRKARDSIGFHAMWTIEKKWPWEKRPYETMIFPHNLALNEGLNALFTLVCGGAETAFSNANANIGVGDSNTAAAATQTGLQATTNKLYKGMEASYPTYGSSQKLTFRSKFASAEANFTWNEITVANGNSDAAKNLNRKVQPMGTKVSPAEWYANLEITGA
jgi:hypothetical protein